MLNKLKIIIKEDTVTQVNTCKCVIGFMGDSEPLPALKHQKVTCCFAQCLSCFQFDNVLNQDFALDLLVIICKYFLHLLEVLPSF